MHAQVSARTQAGCLGTLVAGMVGIAYLAAASFNPLAVYSSGSLAAQAAVSLLGVMAASALLQLASLSMMRRTIAVTAGIPAEDVICPGCGLPLMPYMSSHGIPVACPVCRGWWHSGPQCFNRGAARAGVFPTHPCPRCLAAAAHDGDLAAGLAE